MLNICDMFAWCCNAAKRGVAVATICWKFYIGFSPALLGISAAAMAAAGMVAGKDAGTAAAFNGAGVAVLHCSCCPCCQLHKLHQGNSPVS